VIGAALLAIGAITALSAPTALIEACTMVYAVTDQRAFIVSRLLYRRVTSWAAHELNVLDRRDAGGGSGDIVFRTEVKNIGDGQAAVRRAFYGIRDVRAVEALIANLVRQRVAP
jgi:hypothetical protein